MILLVCQIRWRIRRWRGPIPFAQIIAHGIYGAVTKATKIFGPSHYIVLFGVTQNDEIMYHDPHDGPRRLMTVDELNNASYRDFRPQFWYSGDWKW